MQPFNVPQFVEIEDKIIGPLTLRQFLAVLAGGILVLFYYLIFKYSLFFWILALPTSLLTGFVALGSFNGRPVFAHVFPLIGFVAKPKKRFFQRESASAMVQAQPAAKVETTMAPAEVQSRLKRLAYILDQKEQVEESLIGINESTKSLDTNQPINTNETNNIRINN